MFDTDESVFSIVPTKIDDTSYFFKNKRSTLEQLLGANFTKAIEMEPEILVVKNITGIYLDDFRWQRRK